MKELLWQVVTYPLPQGGSMSRGVIAAAVNCASHAGCHRVRRRRRRAYRILFSDPHERAGVGCHEAPALTHATPPLATPAVSIQFVGDGDSSDESEATLAISPVPTKTPTQVGGEQDMSKSAGFQNDEVIAVPPHRV